jgi:hypothetical protein
MLLESGGSWTPCIQDSYPTNEKLAKQRALETLSTPKQTARDILDPIHGESGELGHIERILVLISALHCSGLFIL